MSDSLDLRKLLASWSYDPENNVRITRGADDRELLQVRLPLGIEQYELEGRPDGQRPHDRESILDFYLEQLQVVQATAAAPAFVLTPEQCAELFEEGMLFYFRYLHLFQLGDWRRTVRDTARNLRLYDFVQRYAHREEDRRQLEKWRPYILRMHGIARAMMELDQHNQAGALEIVRGALRKIQSLPEMEDETFQFERQRSIRALQDFAEHIDRSRPLTELERMEKGLREAVAAQEFEHAAELRDRIRRLREQLPGAGAG